MPQVKVGHGVWMERRWRIECPRLTQTWVSLTGWGTACKPPQVPQVDWDKVSRRLDVIEMMNYTLSSGVVPHPKLTRTARG